MDQVPGISMAREKAELRIVLLSFAMLVVLVGCAPAAPQLPPTAPPSPTITVTNFIFPPTFTPTDPSPPTGTPTPGPSRTPAPTPTPGPTLPASPTPLVDIRLASPDDAPLAAYRMLFVNAQTVRTWDPFSGLIEEIQIEEGFDAEGVRLASFSAGGGRIAIARPAPGGYALLVFDRESGAVLRSIDIEGAELHEIAISPDGAWLAYIVSENESQPAEPTPTPTPGDAATETPTPGPSPSPTPTRVPGTNLYASLFVLRVASEAEPALVADCELDCRGVTWSRASSYFSWGQDDGLWEVDPVLPDDARRLLLPFLAGLSGSVQTVDSYLPIAVSPSGRFLLIRSGLQTGSVFSVYDRATGLAEVVPGTGSYSGAGTGMIWLTGDRLFIARPGLPGPQILPGGEIWGLSPGLETGFYQLQLDFPFPGDVNVRPAAPVELPDGRIAFSLLNFQDGNDAAINGLYILDPGTGELGRINYLPLVKVEEIRWLPDLSGALVLSQSRLLFVPAGFGQIYSLSLLLGPGSCCYQWIP